MAYRVKLNVSQIATPAPCFFSVIITTYNRANLISRALDSLIAQTETDWNAIIVDDESSDDTYCRVLPYLKVSPKIAYVRQPHNGESAAKNIGLWSATGRFITFLDSDDEYDSLHLETRKSVLLKNPSVEFLHGGAKILGNQFVPDRFNYKKMVNLNDCVIGGTFVIDRKLAISLNGFRDILIGPDADLYERAINEGAKMKKINDQTYVYHHDTADSITNKFFVNS